MLGNIFAISTPTLLNGNGGISWLINGSAAVAFLYVLQLEHLATRFSMLFVIPDQ